MQEKDFIVKMVIAKITILEITKFNWTEHNKVKIVHIDMQYVYVEFNQK